MYIAKRKRRENIAEYILYIWQLEDLIRAMGFDMQRFSKLILDPQSLSDQERQSAMFWYEDIANLLISEGKRERGHMSHIDHLLADLHDLHLRLLSSPIGAEYAARFSELEPHMVKLRSSLKVAEGRSDTEIMFVALYSVVLLRLKRAEESRHITDVMEVVSPVVASLADHYRRVELGEIDLFKEE